MIHRSRLTRLALAALLFVTQSIAATSPAPPPVVETPAMHAAKLKSQANQAMIEMHYADALSLYNQAREADPADATILYSVGRANEFLGDFPTALDALDHFAKDAPAEAQARVGKIDGLLTDLRARIGTVTLVCNVPGARVLLRDRDQGVTPLAPFRANAGAATLEVTLDGFFSEKRDIVLPGGGATSVEVTLRKRATSGVLGITTEPLGSQVFVDGNPVGTSSPRLELVLEAGEHRVLARHDGFDDAIVPIVLTPGGSRDVGLTLEKSVAITQRWWFWTGVGVVVVGGVVLTTVLLTDRKADSGTLAPGQIAAPLRF